MVIVGYDGDRYSLYFDNDGFRIIEFNGFMQTNLTNIAMMLIIYINL